MWKIANLENKRIRYKQSVTKIHGHCAIQNRNTVTFADKTINLSRLTKEENDKSLQNAVTSKNKKIAKKIKDKIDEERKRILNHKDVVKRLHINGDSNCFIAMKDHQENFKHKPGVRLINPAKSQIGRITKVILDKIIVVIESK